MERGLHQKTSTERGKYGGVDLVADELAACATLIMKQAAEGVPVVVVRGLKYEKDGEMSKVRIPARIMVVAFLKSFLYTLVAKFVLAFRRKRPGSPPRWSG